MRRGDVSTDTWIIQACLSAFMLLILPWWVMLVPGDKNFRKKLQAEASKGIFNVLLTSYEYVMKDAGSVNS